MDSFVDMADAADGGEPEAPKPGEVVYGDADHVLCRRWNWRQDARSLVTPETRQAILTIQFNGEGDLFAATEDFVSLLSRFAGGTARVVVADRSAPVAVL